MAALCLYCDSEATSREHVLASGIGGHLVNSQLICGAHNNLCGKFADDPLSRQFSYAVHSLDVLKGNRDRGTTLQPLLASDGTTIKILPDRTTEIPTRVEWNEDGKPKRIIGTHAPSIQRIERQFQALPQPPVPASLTESMRYDDLPVNIQTGGEGQRGVLKAALHFAAHLAMDTNACRTAARALSPQVFSEDDTSFSFVRFAPYSIQERTLGHEFHEMVIWGDGPATIIKVSLFNVVHFVVKLDNISTPRAFRYLQYTRSGSREISPTDPPPKLTWYDCFEFPPQSIKDELDWRIDQVMTVGRCKGVVIRLIESAKRRTVGYDHMNPNDKRKSLFAAVPGFSYPISISPHTADALVWFAKQRILQETPGATWHPEHVGD